MANNRDKALTTATIQEKLAAAKPLITTTAAGALARGVFWSSEWMYTNKTMKPPTSYQESFRMLLTWKGFWAVHSKFPKTGLLPNIGKSLSNAGVLSYMDQYHADWSSVKKTLFVAGLPFEPFVTCYFDREKIEAFKAVQAKGATLKDESLFGPGMRRIFWASYFRSVTSSILTFYPILKTQEELTRAYPHLANNAWLGAASGAIGSVIAQPFVVPITTFQTRVIEKTGVPILTTAKEMAKNPIKLLDGTAARAFNRAGVWGTTFFMIQRGRKTSKEPEGAEHKLKPRAGRS